MFRGLQVGFIKIQGLIEIQATPCYNTVRLEFDKILLGGNQYGKEK
jgi:hypothetical protein